jgi:hypothetical protein
MTILTSGDINKDQSETYFFYETKLKPKMSLRICRLIKPFFKKKNTALIFKTLRKENKVKREKKERTNLLFEISVHICNCLSQ